ncbi:MAG: DUF4349 domain-containing protein [Actinomycetota bacterium]
MSSRTMSPRAKRAIGWGIAFVVVLGIGALALGNATTSSTFSHTGTSVDTGGTTQGGRTVAAPSQANTTSGDVSPAAALPDIPDRIARTADLTVQVKKGLFDAAWAAAFRVASKYDGQIMSSTRGIPTPQPVPANGDASGSQASKQPAFGDITMRIPASRFVDATNALRALGSVQGDNTKSEDVSQEYVDLQSRLRNLRGEQNVLLKLFDRTNTIKDTLAVQAQLSNVEGQIEQVTGRINYLDSRTVFSTVTLHLLEPGISIVGKVAPSPSLGGAWETAKKGLVRIAGASLILGLWLAPFAAVAAAGMALRRRLRRPAPQA